MQAIRTREGAMMNRRILVVLTMSVMGVIAVCSLGMGQAQDRPKLGYKDTPMLPGGKWHVHDGDRPQPPVVTPGTASTQDQPGRPPSDAVVLFDGKDLSKWQGNRKKPGWEVPGRAKIAPPPRPPGGGPHNST